MNMMAQENSPSGIGSPKGVNTKEQREVPTLNNDLINMVKDYQTVDDEWKIAIYEYVGELLSRKQLCRESDRRNRQNNHLIMTIPEDVPWNYNPKGIGSSERINIPLTRLTREQMYGVCCILSELEENKILLRSNPGFILSPIVIVGFFYNRNFFMILTSSFEFIDTDDVDDVDITLRDELIKQRSQIF